MKQKRQSPFLSVLTEDVAKISWGVIAVASALSPAMAPLYIAGALLLHGAAVIFLPGSPWYQRRLRRRYDKLVSAARAKARTELLPRLPIDCQNRYALLEERRDQIFAELGDNDDPLLMDLARKLDFMLDKFLAFASKQQQFDAFLQGRLPEGEIPVFGPVPQPPKRRREKAKPPEEIGLLEAAEARLAELREAIDAERAQEKPDEQSLDILERSLSIVERQHEKFVEMDKMVSRIAIQLGAIEDTFQLIHGEIVAMRSPTHVMDDLDSVVAGVESTALLVEQTEPIRAQLEALDQTLT